MPKGQQRPRQSMVEHSSELEQISPAAFFGAHEPDAQ
jgi:hypothetical protein